ncbi:LPXTG cell wall anchor domain-containing protein [Streptomyces mirabilis]|uniref:LPXTG cell wall anchor domain-containing protein n=1 Tax=Streptomyces mirabilis TaxID=68239 RepID=UPI0036E8AC95
MTVTNAETATTPEHREADRERLRRVKGHPDGHRLFDRSRPRTGTDSASPKAPAGSLARTGADTTAWILGGAGLLLAGGIGAVVAVRGHKDSGSEQDESDETN